MAVPSREVGAWYCAPVLTKQGSFLARGSMAEVLMAYMLDTVGVVRPKQQSRPLAWLDLYGTTRRVGFWNMCVDIYSDVRLDMRLEIGV